MGHLHSRELQETLTESHAAQQQLSVTSVARSVLMLRTTVASSDTIHVLIALTAVFRKVNACSEHSTNVSMTLIKSFLDDCLDEGRPVEQHPLIALIVVLLSHLPPPVAISLPQLGVPDLLYFINPVVGE